MTDPSRPQTPSIEGLLREQARRIPDGVAIAAPGRKALAQVYVVFFGIAGVVGARLLPVRGWRIAFMEHLIQTLAMLVALLALWQSGSSNLALIVVPLQAIAIVTFILMADRNVRPSLDARLLRVGPSLATGLSLYALGELLGVPTLIQAVVASAGIVLWLHPKTCLASIHARAADS